MSPPSSGWKNKIRKQMLYAGFFLGLIFDPEDGTDMSLGNL
jgi:hypothetical protein